MKNGNNRDSF